MAQHTIYICDQCGIESGSLARWFEFKVMLNAIIFAPPGEMLWPGEGNAVEHVCGEQCAAKRFSEFLGSVNRSG